jgi:hypothetical protein
MASSSSTISSSGLPTPAAYGDEGSRPWRFCLTQTFGPPSANPVVRRVSRVKILMAVVAAAVVIGGCSSGGTTKHTAAQAPTTTAAAPSTSTTAAPQMTCAPSTSAGGAGGKGDVTPPGDIPDNQAFVSFSAPGQYTIKAPEGWARTDAGAITSFTDKLNTIRVELKPSPAPPSVQSAQAQDVPAIAAQSRCFETPKVSTAQRRAGPAVLITYRADSAPDPVTGKVIHDDVEQYQFWKPGTEAVVTLSSPQGSDNVDPWRTVTDSFAWSS